MAFITLQQMYDAWKRVSDWVSGANTDKPKVVNVNGSGTEIFTDANPAAMKLTGRNVEEVAIVAGVELRTISTVTTAEINVSKYKEFDYRIINTLVDANGDPIDLRIGFNIGASTPLNVPKLDGSYLTYAASETSATGIFNRIKGFVSARSTYLSLNPLVYANNGSPLTVSDVMDIRPWQKLRMNHRITYKASALPVSGSVSIILVGVPN